MSDLRKTIALFVLSGVALALAVACLSTSHGEEDRPSRYDVGVVPRELAEAIKLYDRGTTNNDVADLGRLVKDDYLLINSDGSAQNKRSYLADFAKPGFKIGRYELVQPFQIFAKDSALVGGILNLTWTQDGARFERRLRVVHFWVRQNGRWRLAYTQLTRDPRLPK